MNALQAHGAELLEHFLAIYAVLVTVGLPGNAKFEMPSSWWQETISRFLLSGCRQLVARVGRRGRKSVTFCVLAVTIGLFGKFTFPLGELLIIAIISANREQAGDRLRMIASILTALGVAFRRSGDTIELEHRPIAFRVYTASISGVVGGTVVFAFCDELAHWPDADAGAKPASEILPQLTAAMISQPNSLIVLSSSPLSTLDAHYDAFERGNNEFQMVAHAPTWVADPSIPKATTQAWQPNLRHWSMNYAAIPGAVVAEVIPGDAQADSFIKRRLQARTAGVWVVDAAKGRNGDFYTSATAGWAMTEATPEILMHDMRDPRTGEVTGRGIVVALDAEGRTVPDPAHKPSQSILVIDRLTALDGDFATRMGADDVALRHARECRAAGVKQVWGDQYEALGLESAYRNAGNAIGWPLEFNSITWGNANKSAAVERLRALFMSRQIQLPPDEKLKRELATFSERILPSGAIRYEARQGHDDYVMLLVLAAAIDLQRVLPLSPIRQSHGLAVSGGGWLGNHSHR